MATRSAASLNVVNNPTTSYSARCRRTCKLHALSLPLLHDKRVRFMECVGPSLAKISLTYPVFPCDPCVKDFDSFSRKISANPWPSSYFSFHSGTLPAAHGAPALSISSSTLPTSTPTSERSLLLSSSHSP